MKSQTEPVASIVVIWCISSIGREIHVRVVTFSSAGIKKSRIKAMNSVPGVRAASKRDKKVGRPVWKAAVR